MSRHARMLSAKSGPIVIIFVALYLIFDCCSAMLMPSNEESQIGSLIQNSSDRHSICRSIKVDNAYLDNHSIDLGGVTVKLSDETGALVATTVTDSFGNYCFYQLTIGTYHVTLESNQNDQSSSDDNDRSDKIKEANKLLFGVNKGSGQHFQIGKMSSSLSAGTPLAPGLKFSRERAALDSLDSDVSTAYSQLEDTRVEDVTLPTRQTTKRRGPPIRLPRAVSVARSLRLLESPTKKPTWKRRKPRPTTTFRPPTKQPTKKQPPTKPPTKKQPPTKPPTKKQPPTKPPTKKQPPTKQPTTLRPTTKQPTTLPPTKKQPPTKQPTPNPTRFPTIKPINIYPIRSPTKKPTISPMKSPTTSPTRTPTILPTLHPSVSPSQSPTQILSSTKQPTPLPTVVPSESPSQQPSLQTTIPPSNVPLSLPSKPPTASPIMPLTTSPIKPPTKEPTTAPTKLDSTMQPSLETTIPPSNLPTLISTENPIKAPSLKTTILPTNVPTSVPTKTPTMNPTQVPTLETTIPPTNLPTSVPTKTPTMNPTQAPTLQTTVSPTNLPTSNPTKSPTMNPIMPSIPNSNNSSGANDTSTGLQTAPSAPCPCNIKKRVPSKCEVQFLIELLDIAVTGQHKLAPQWLRLSFHDAGTFNQTIPAGGANGCLMTDPRMRLQTENSNLDIAINTLEQIKDNWEGLKAVCIDISNADIIQFAGLFATVRQTGPVPGITPDKINQLMTFQWGRPDEQNCEIEWTVHLPGFDTKTDPSSLPLRCNAAGKEIQNKMMAANGFTVEEATALIGAHTIGLTRNVFGSLAAPWVVNGADDATPSGPIFDNSYFDFLANTIVEKSMTGFGTNPAPFTTIFPTWVQAEVPRTLNHLDTDLALAFAPEKADDHPGFNIHTIAFSKDKQLFLDTFNKAQEKMGMLGVPAALKLRTPSSCTNCQARTDPITVPTIEKFVTDLDGATSNADASMIAKKIATREETIAQTTPLQSFILIEDGTKAEEIPVINPTVLI